MQKNVVVNCVKRSAKMVFHVVLYKCTTFVQLLLLIKMENVTDKQRFKRCVPPCPRFITGGDTHNMCVVCLGAEHTESALTADDLLPMGDL